MAGVLVHGDRVGGRPIPGQALKPSAFLFDLDGTLYTDREPIPGAADAIAELRRRGMPLRFVTNTTRRPHQDVFERLHGLGFEVGMDELFTPATAAHRVLTELRATSIAPFFPRATFVDFHSFALVGGLAGSPSPSPPDAVVLGDLGDEWSPAYLNEAFRYVMDGAAIIALQKGRYWQSADGLRLDAGPFVAAIEYATGRQAVVCGKPSERFFRAVVKSLKLPSEASSVAMVGDDLWNDIGGAQRAGLQGWLVRTGKFREDVLAGSEVRPDRVLGSMVEVLDALA